MLSFALLADHLGESHNFRKHRGEWGEEVEALKELEERTVMEAARAGLAGMSRRFTFCCLERKQKQRF